MVRHFHPTSIFLQKPYCTIIAYPNPTKRRITSRIAELEKIGVTKVAFEGSSEISGLPILGKGYVGLVVLARYKSKTVAIKIRRFDSRRPNMKGEAKLLELANSGGVGPKLYAASKNFLVMEHLDGKRIGTWLYDDKITVKKVKTCIKKTLQDCHNLDTIGLDHGEVGRISKHVIVGKKTTLIDFESASTKRRTANVTSATQGIFIATGISKRLRQIMKIPRKDKVILALQNYKAEPNNEKFSQILEVTGLK